MSRSRLALSLVLALSACNGSDGSSDGDGGSGGPVADVDTDGDGLTDGQEESFGSDPAVADTDGDGLTDGEEFDLGTDPTAIDTDGDTYSDRDEVTEGHSPTDDKDRIYKGYWPYNPDKEELGSPGFDGMPVASGDKFGRFKEKDQFGDKVDLFDFAGAGKMTVIDASALWCGPCQDMATWLSTGVGSYESSYSAVREAVNDGKVRWITVITDDNQDFDGTQPEDVKAWDELFPNEMIPVITDPDSNVLMAVNFDGGTGLSWPMFVVLNKKMKVELIGGSTEVLAYVNAEL